MSYLKQNLLLLGLRPIDGMKHKVSNSENTDVVSSANRESFCLHDVGESHESGVLEKDKALVEGALEKITYIEKTSPCPNCGSERCFKKDGYVYCTICDCQRGCL